MKLTDQVCPELARPGHAPKCLGESCAMYRVLTVYGGGLVQESIEFCGKAGHPRPISRESERQAPSNPFGI